MIFFIEIILLLIEFYMVKLFFDYDDVVMLLLILKYKFWTTKLMRYEFWSCSEF